MTWQTVESKIVFWTPGAWILSGWKLPPGPADAAFKATMTTILRELYESSPTAARYLDNLTSGNRTLKIAPLADGDARESPAFAAGAGQPNEGIQINLVQAASELYWFNENGKLVLADLRLTIAHELSHLFDNTAYTNGIGQSDPVILIGDKFYSPPDSVQNQSDFDFDGRAVRDQNRIARELGLPEQVRASYQGTDYINFQPGHEPNRDYTDGNTVRTVRYGQNQVNAPGEGDNIDHSLRTPSSPGGLTDLIFGFGGNDKIFAGGGRDYIYGGLGSDLIHGGYRDGDDAAFASDGVDTVGFIDKEADGAWLKINIGGTPPVAPQGAAWATVA